MYVYLPAENAVASLLLSVNFQSPGQRTQCPQGLPHAGKLGCRWHPIVKQGISGSLVGDANVRPCEPKTNRYVGLREASILLSYDWLTIRYESVKADVTCVIGNHCK
jgi:hypothetical protein